MAIMKVSMLCTSLAGVSVLFTHVATHFGQYCYNKAHSKYYNRPSRRVCAQDCISSVGVTSMEQNRTACGNKYSPEMLIGKNFENAMV